jgi:hypothetical protein
MAFLQIVFPSRRKMNWEWSVVKWWNWRGFHRFTTDRHFKNRVPKFQNCTKTVPADSQQASAFLTQHNRKFDFFKITRSGDVTPWWKLFNLHNANATFYYTWWLRYYYYFGSPTFDEKARACLIPTV